ncbi:MAG: class I SAM-dependent methyltransferase [Clostridium sp.]
MDNTIDYYNKNAGRFIRHTVDVDFSSIQKLFQDKLPVNARILDFGCGAGRDTKYFAEQGFQVDAMDGSETLCKSASEYTGIEVKNMLFQDLEEVDVYDGIWACSSILHLNKSELAGVFRKMYTAVKKHGIIYTSFKYGEFEGERDGRYFTDMTEWSFHKFMELFPELSIEELWVTEDVRPGRGDEKWLNLILRK